MKNRKSTIKDYAELDKKLLRIADLEATRGSLENNLNLDINKLKENYQVKADIIDSELLSLETDIELFCKANKNDFTCKKGSQTRSKKLIYGTVKFRKSPGAIVLLKEVKNGMKKAAQALYAIYKNKYVRMVPEVNKDALAAAYRKKEIGDLDLAGVNLRFEKGDVFSYSLNWSKLQKDKQLVKPEKSK